MSDRVRRWFYRIEVVMAGVNAIAVISDLHKHQYGLAVCNLFGVALMAYEAGKDRRKLKKEAPRDGQ